MNLLFVMKCPLTLRFDFNVTFGKECRQLMSRSVLLNDYALQEDSHHNIIVFHESRIIFVSSFFFPSTFCKLLCLLFFFFRVLLSVMSANLNHPRKRFQDVQSETLLQNPYTVLYGQNIYLSM